MENTATDFYSHLNWVDVAVCALLLFSLVVGLLRGFFTQIAGILGVVGSIFVALRFAPVVSNWLIEFSPRIPTATADLGCFVGLFIVTLVLWMILTHYLKKLMVRLDFGTFDRVLGGAFGLVKGTIVAYVFLILVHRFIPTTWSVNQELVSSKAHRGIEFFDSILRKQKDHIPSAAWEIIATLRRFESVTEDNERSSRLPDRNLVGGGDS